MTVPYAWIIDKDRSPNLERPEGTNCNAKGVAGPGNCDPEALRLLKASTRNGTAFRLCYDEDPKDPDYVAYKGRILWNPAIDEATYVSKSGLETILGLDVEIDWEFAPLEDFGGPNAGCAIIEYKNAESKWEVL